MSVFPVGTMALTREEK